MEYQPENNIRERTILNDIAQFKEPISYYAGGRCGRPALEKLDKRRLIEEVAKAWKESDDKDKIIHTANEKLFSYEVFFKQLRDLLKTCLIEEKGFLIDRVKILAETYIDVKNLYNK